ncbi:MAG TPA: antitoxin Xre/MbcA/ParS toxin-binding domain-containing protein [Xanthobacteraceae bacterium]|nr:antitoxin Xre/MbcA/ParS toxin-binding domain-containing protein [Xanthobacteraceae bacterium]
MRPQPSRDPVPSDSSIVIKALVRAADRLDVPNKTVAKIIGVSEASFSRMRRGDYLLEGKPLELAVMFVRLYRSLDAVGGGDDTVARAWLRNTNTALKDYPIDLIQTVAGLTDVIQYLDARRAVS